MTEHRTPETPEPDRRAQGREASEEERAAARPFSYRYPERHADVRATRHISREQADAESVPGVPGGYGTTGGGQPGGRGTPLPGRETPDEEAGVTEIVTGREPRSDRQPRPGRDGDTQ
ncbi:hypothetical protein ACFOOM_27860 [Streptomyces echinoruber]|uniref:Uncharacterized protein n=1 Tax=Streptomyces echinoruber TaxID=68898 RepID=A0A918VNK8_9ACTN|nr:hypothetical protein [Streptomyces echinoruber]GHA11571.1 hypothetical protein GCM10010389_58240 [Streptomyces echinoruber]